MCLCQCRLVRFSTVASPCEQRGRGDAIPRGDPLVTYTHDHLAGAGGTINLLEALREQHAAEPLDLFAGAAARGGSGPGGPARTRLQCPKGGDPLAGREGESDEARAPRQWGAWDLRGAGSPDTRHPWEISQVRNHGGDWSGKQRRA